MKNTVIILLISFFTFLNTTNAQNIVENITTNTFYNSIQGAIDSAVNGDTLIAQPGNYLENINFSGKNIVVASEYLLTGDTLYIDSTIIDGNQNGSCVVFENGEDTTALLCGFTITNGSGYYFPNYDTSSTGYMTAAFLGGGIYCDSASSKLYYLKIINNLLMFSNYTGGYGVGIYLNNSSSIIEKCEVSNNASFYTISAIFCLNSHAKIYETLIMDNSINSLIAHSSCLTIVDANFVNNSSFYGAEIHAIDSKVYLQNATIVNNMCSGDGGGIYCENSNFNIDNTLIMNNISSLCGGISIYSSDTFLMSNTKIIENSGLRAGGIMALNSNLKLSKLEIIGNEAEDGIAGVELNDCTFGFRKCMIIRNDGHSQSLSGLSVSNSQGFIINSTIANNNCNLELASVVIDSSDIIILNTIIHKNYGSENIQYDLYGNTEIAYSNIGFLNPNSLIYSQGNIQTAPLFVNPIPSVPYTGYQNLNYELLWNSPCIDAGIDFYIYNGDTILDLDPSEYYGSSPDIGYYEYDFQANTSIDIGVVEMIYPTDINCGLTAADSVIVLVRNFGSDTIFNYTIYFNMGSSNSYFSVNDTILPGANSETPPEYLNFSGISNFEISIWTGLPNGSTDFNTINDTLNILLNQGTTIDNFPYFSDFENDAGYWYSNSYLSSWECGIPDGLEINSAASGSNVWATNLSGTIFLEDSYIESPCFDFSSLINPAIMFNFISDLEFEEGAALQSSIDGGTSWQYVGAVGDTGNWYNNTCSGLNAFGNSTDAWNSFNSQIEWRNASHSLQYLAGESNVKFRFIISCQQSLYYSEGFAFDDFSIYDLDTTQNIETFQQKPYVLYQNTPNPFAENTEITFFIPKQSDVEISIYNILGEKIETFISKSFATGNHSIKFNSKNYNSGTYFYKMICPDFVDTKSMLILY